MKTGWQYIVFLSFLLLGSVSIEGQVNQKTGVIVHFNNEMKNTAEGTPTFSTISKNLSDEIYSWAKNNLDLESLTAKHLYKKNFDSLTYSNPEEFNSYFEKVDTLPKFYLILGSINTFNNLIYITANTYFIYQQEPLKYLNLFRLKTKYYHPTKPTQVKIWDKIKPELLLQLKTGLDDKINVVFKSVLMDSTQKQFSFLKDAVPEYLKSRLVISNKIKVHRDTILNKIPGVTQRPQYIVDAFVFYDRNQVHVLANCVDYDENQIIISKKISFNIDNPANLEPGLSEIGDDFRNAILNLYNNKVQKRRTSFAIVAMPPFFNSKKNADVYGMNMICENVISSLISSFRTDTLLSGKFEFVRTADYFSKIDEYLNSSTEISVITSELNAEILIIIQTTGNPDKFDLNIQKYNPKEVNELHECYYFRDIHLSSIKDSLDKAYCKIRTDLLSSIEKGKPINTSNIGSPPSNYYDLLPRKLGIRIMGLQSAINNLQSIHLFLGNPYRPGVEIAAYYSTSLWNFPVIFESSFMYDFGQYRDYTHYGQDAQGRIYARNLNFILKTYCPLYERIKNMVRYYLGFGITMIDVHRVSTHQSSLGSFEQGWLIEGGAEYSLSYNLYLDLNLRYLFSNNNFKTLNEFKDETVYGGSYRAFYIGGGLGYEF